MVWAKGLVSWRAGRISHVYFINEVSIANQNNSSHDIGIITLMFLFYTYKSSPEVKEKQFEVSHGTGI